MSINNLLKLNLPNITIEKVLQESPERTNGFTCLGVGLPEGMHKFIEAVAIKHPEWVLEAYNVQWREDVDTKSFYIQPYSFKVYENKTIIGSLSSEYSYGRRKDMYVVREEKNLNTIDKSVKTSDPQKAAKNALKMLRPITDVEKFDYLMGKTEQLLSSVNMSTGRHVQSYLNSNREEMIEFVKNNIEKFIKTYADDEYARKSVEKFLVLHEEEEILENLENNVNTAMVIKVVQEGDTYYMRNAKKEFFVHKLEDLSEDIKYKLGILKLVEVKQAVKGIGFRGLVNSFILTS